MSEKRFQIAFVTTIQMGSLGFNHISFPHQRLSKDLRKAKRRDAEALWKVCVKRSKKKRRSSMSSASSQPQEFFSSPSNRPTLPNSNHQLWRLLLSGGVPVSLPTKYLLSVLWPAFPLSGDSITRFYIFGEICFLHQIKRRICKNLMMMWWWEKVWQAPTREIQLLPHILSHQQKK